MIKIDGKLKLYVFGFHMITENKYLMIIYPMIPLCTILAFDSDFYYFSHTLIQSYIKLLTIVEAILDF